MTNYPYQTPNTSGWGYTITKTCRVSGESKGEASIGAFDRLEKKRTPKFSIGFHWKVWQVNARTATEIERDLEHQNNGWVEEICGLAPIIS